MLGPVNKLKDPVFLYSATLSQMRFVVLGSRAVDMLEDLIGITKISSKRALSWAVLRFPDMGGHVIIIVRPAVVIHLVGLIRKTQTHVSRWCVTMSQNCGATSDLSLIHI